MVACLNDERAVLALPFIALWRCPALERQDSGPKRARFALARAAGPGARVESLLRREVDTVSQTHHDRRQRQANLKNAFALARPGELNPDQHIILVDDVFTTGSTLNSCALVLRRAGCLNLDVITFGHG